MSRRSSARRFRATAIAPMFKPASAAAKKIAERES
jgi:hypothetical protein